MSNLWYSLLFFYFLSPQPEVVVLMQHFGQFLSCLFENTPSFSRMGLNTMLGQSLFFHFWGTQISAHFLLVSPSFTFPILQPLFCLILVCLGSFLSISDELSTRSRFWIIALLSIFPLLWEMNDVLTEHRIPILQSFSLSHLWMLCHCPLAPVLPMTSMLSDSFSFITTYSFCAGIHKITYLYRILELYCNMLNHVLFLPI